MRKLIACTLIALAFVSCNQTDDNLSKDISIPVSVDDLQLKSIERYIETTGNVSPIKEATLKSEIGGVYNLLLNPKTGKRFALGDYIAEGQEIIRIDDKEFENNIKISSLELRLEISKQVYEKQQSLYEKGGVTLSELKNAEIDYINSKYSYDDAQLRLSKMTVKAPFSGVIVELPYHTPNTRIDANTELFKIMDYSQLYLETSLAEKDYPTVKIGQGVKITNYTLPNDTLNGLISQISPAIDVTTRSFKTMITISNPNLLLRPGMFAKGEIVVARVDSALVIPKSVIISKQRGNTVFVVDKGLAQERLVTFGLENQTEVQITSGLEKGERLVTKGFETLRNRSKVKVVR